VETITGGAGDDIINALAANPLTNAAQTTINSGDVVNGGEGNDTLNITITPTNNTSLTGLTVSGVEIVNVTGANNQNAAAAALSAATASKATTAAALTARQAEGLLATQQRDAAVSVASLVDSAGATTTANLDKVGEAALVSASTVTATTAAQLAAAARAVAALTTAADVTAASTSTTALPSGTSYTLAQYNAAASAALRGANGSTLSTNGDVTGRAASLATAANNVWVAVEAAASSSDPVEAQKAAAAQAILTGIGNNSAAAGEALVWVDAQIAISDANFTALNTTAYTKAQYVAAATAVKTAFNGTTALTSNADLAARATELDTFADAVVAVSGDYTVAQLNSAAAAALRAADGSTLVTAGDDEDAMEARADALVTLNGNVKTAADNATSAALSADIAAGNALSVATTNAASATASVSGSQFTGATQVWLVGADSNKTNLTVGTGQTAGLNGVTGLANTVAFGTTGALAVSGSSGTVDIAGASSGLTISGTGTTGLVLTNTTATTVASSLKTIAVGTSGAAVLDVSSLGQLTSVTISDAGAVTINPKTAATKLASVTSTGTGASTVRINTTTAIDDVATTTVNETVSAVVSTSTGADVVNVATSGAGTTTITTSAGGDTVYVTSVGTGVSSVNTGDDNDTVHLNVALGSNPNLTVNAGSGNDTLVMAGGAALTSVDYARINAALSGFEAVRFNSATAGVDASKLSIGTITGFTFNAGANTITEVGAGQTLTLARAATVTATDIVPGFTGVAPTSLTASSAGYVVGSGSTATAYGGNLTVANSGTGAVAMTLNGAAATVGVTSTGASSTTSYAPAVTLGAAASDLQALTVNLTSARGTSTNAATEYVATFNAGTIANTAATTYGEHLEALASLKVNGSGVFTITTGTVAAALAKLTTIDVSGMTAFADQDVNGLLVTAPYTNRSTTSITLNNNVAETVILGGARDTVLTGSTFARMDTITGFQLTANSTTPTVVDTTRSDVLNVGAGGAFAKFTTTATTLIGALTAAGADAGARLVFQFGGDTYVYVDLATGGTSIAGLDDGDQLVKLTGNYDLDLLIQAGVLI
jgi:hypothetical protein